MYKRQVLIREDDSLSTFLLGRVGVNVRSLRDEVGRAVASLQMCIRDRVLGSFRRASRTRDLL